LEKGIEGSWIQARLDKPMFKREGEKAGIKQCRESIRTTLVGTMELIRQLFSTH
jgi:hypothetical protein